MRLRLDWKFLLPLVVSVFGVLATVWVWQADLNGKSLSIKLVSRASLEPTTGRPVPEMEISIDGAKLKNPYVVTFEITNEGRKPIPSGDFESPIEIRLESDTSFVRPKITATTPKDIDADLAVEQKKIGLKPLLLNPQDSVVITAITTGDAPEFASKARISGIPFIPLLDGTKAKKAGTWGLLVMLAGFCLFLVSGAAGVGAWPSKGVWVAPNLALFIQMVTSIPAGILFITALTEFGIDSAIVWVVAGLGALVFFSQLGALWVRVSKWGSASVESNQNHILIGKGGRQPQLPTGAPQLSDITARKIEESIDLAPPLQRVTIQQRYIGLEVVWDTVLRSGSINGDKTVDLMLKPEAGNALTSIRCEVPLSEYGELEALPAGAKIRVYGKIIEAARFDIKLQDVKLYIYQ